MSDYLAALDVVWSSDFWSGWVMALVAINYSVILFLFLWAPWVKIPTVKDGTTGHVWSNGAIREGLKKLPRWWLIMSTAAFIGAFLYLVRYPGFGAHEGTLKWTSHQQMQEQIAETNAKMAPLWETIKSQPILELNQAPQAMQLGQRLFDDNCAACHGYDAKGNQVIGAPDLTDNTWLYGGKVKDVVHSITEGRHGVMPAWKNILHYGQIKNVAHYVLSLSGASHDSGAADVGKEVFDTSCIACHGADGTGNQQMGAANLADDVWKYGGSLKDIMATVEDGRQGHMPAWKDRLDKEEIRVLAAWVLSHDNTAEAVATGDE